MGDAQRPGRATIAVCRGHPGPGGSKAGRLALQAVRMDTMRTSIYETSISPTKIRRIQGRREDGRDGCDKVMLAAIRQIPPVASTSQLRYSRLMCEARPGQQQGPVSGRAQRDGYRATGRPMPGTGVGWGAAHRSRGSQPLRCLARLLHR